MLAPGHTRFGAVAVAVALAAPVSAFALSTTSTPELYTSNDSTDARDRMAGERLLHRTPSLAPSPPPAKLASESRKWVTPDPLFLEDPKAVVDKPLAGADLYAYVNNNPVSLTDPDGLEPIGADFRAAGCGSGGGCATGPTLDVGAAVSEGNRQIDLHRSSAGESFGSAWRNLKAGDFEAAKFFAGQGLEQAAGFVGAVAGHPVTQAGMAVSLAATAGRMLGAAGGALNEIPSTLARVIPGKGPFPTLGPPGRADVFVTAVEDIAGLNPAQIAERLTIPRSSTYTIFEFPTPAEGLASPVLRSDPGFVGRGFTAGGAREFVLPNGPVPSGAATRVVGP